MPNAAQFLRLAQHIAPPDANAPADTELLRRYVAERDEEAFTELVRRNGPLVLRVCRHVLGEAVADDAFQATFLLLARSAGRLTEFGSLAGWLHAAAVRVARDARRGEDRRRKREAAVRTPVIVADDLTWREVREILDAEIAALPECDRLPILLCCVQELSYEEAARRVGCPVGTLRNRLDRGREKLRKRLARYGLPLAAPVLVLGRPPVVSAALIRVTLDSLRTGFVRVTATGVWTVPIRLKVAILASVAAVGIAFAASGNLTVGPLDQKPAVPPMSATPAGSPPRTDPLGDPLPPGAIMRLGTRRFQVQTWPIPPVLLAGGKHYLTYLTDRREFQWMDAGSGVVTDRWPVPAARDAAGVSSNGRWAVVAEPKYFTTGLRVKPDPKTAPIRFDLYDLTTRTVVKSFECESDEVEGFLAAVHGACVSVDAKWIATANSGHSQTGRVRLWEVATGKVVWTSEFPDINGPKYTPLGFTPGSGELVLRASKDNRIHVVDTATGKSRSFPTMSDQIQGEVLAPDGSAVVLGTYSPAVRIWDLKTGAERPALDGHKEWARRFALTPDGKTLVTAGNDPYLLVRDWPSGTVRKRIEIGHGAVSELLVSDDGRFADVLFWWEMAMARYDLATGKRVDRPAETHRAEVLAVAAGADGTILSLGRDKILRQWDPEIGRQIAQSPLDPGNSPGQITLTPDGKIASPQCLSPDGRFRADADSNTVVVTDLKTRQTVSTLPAGPCGWWSGPIAAVFSPDGRILATTDQDQVRLWATDNWQQPRGSIPEGTSGMAFSPDGRMLVTTDLNDVTVWEVGTRSVRFKHRPGVQLPTSARFSPNGRFVSWAIRSGAVEVWDISQGKVIAKFKGHDGSLRGYTFTLDSSRIVTASDDCTLLVWDAVGAARTDNATRLDERQAKAAWVDLASGDAAKAFAAVRTLAAAPDDLARLARANLHPALPLDKALIDRFLAELGSEDFETRERATKGLKEIGEQVEKSVAAYRARTESPEVVRRADEVLIAVRTAMPGTDRLRAMRAVEALERADTPITREILKELAKGNADAELTRAKQRLRVLASVTKDSRLGHRSSTDRVEVRRQLLENSLHEVWYSANGSWP